MKLYWSYKSIPELQHLPDTEAYELFMKTYQQTYRSWRGFLAIGIFAIITASRHEITDMLLPEHMKQYALILGFSINFVAVFIWDQIFKHNIRHILQQKNATLPSEHNVNP